MWREIASQASSGSCLRNHSGDLSSIAGASALGAQLGARLRPGAVLIHNAGLWPARCELTPEGYERSYAVNHAGPSALQAPLLAAGKLARVMVVSAGLIVKGHFDPARTPRGADFSGIRTYANTKRAFAEATRALAAAHPDVDFIVLHPGVVRSDLGARDGLFGGLLEWLKRNWEAPEVCAARLARTLDLPRWSEPGNASWYFEDKSAPWPI